MAKVCEPDGYEKFFCDGSKCSAACCKNWNIDIDPVTFEMYGELEEGKDILKAICPPEGNRPGKVKLEGGVCPFLDKDYLCSIQRKYGEKYLGNVCATYPRKIYRMGDAYRRSLSLSCPVAASLLLLGDTPRFVERDFDPKELRSYSTVLTGEIPSRRYLGQMSAICMEFLRETNLTIDERLMLLASFLEDGDVLLGEDGEPDFVGLKASYDTPLLREKFFSAAQKIPFNDEAYICFMLALFNELLKAKALLINPGEKSYGSYIVGAFYKKNTDFEKIIRISRNCRKKYMPYAPKCSLILTNYLMQDFFIKLYPCAIKGSFSQNFALFLTEYKFLEFILIASLETKDEISADFLLELCSGIARRTNHSLKFRDASSRVNEKMGADSLWMLRTFFYDR